MEAMEALKGKRVLVTGGTGFVGSHLVEALAEKGASVVVPFRSLDPRSYFSTQKLGDRVVLAAADLKDFPRVWDIITKYDIEYIFHLGAQAIVTTAYHNPRETIESNVLGTTNILEAARLYGRIKGIIVASSDKAYGKSTKPYVESNPLRGDHPYEVSKAATDLIASAYFKTYGTPVVITRFGNIYGEGDLNFTRIIPGALKAIITDTTLEIRSDGTFVRDYVYVKDVISAYLFLLHNLDRVKGEAFNISCDQSFSVFEVVKIAEKVFGRKIPYTIANTAKNEIPYQHLEWRKIQKLGWKPANTLIRGLRAAFTWYKRHERMLFG